MRVTSIVFPFRQTFRRLELEKRWWHRLCVVAFFAVLLCAAVFTAWVAYFSFSFSVATMPYIETGFSDQPRLSSEADVNSILTEADRAALPVNVPLPPQGAHVQGTMTLKQFGQRVKAKYPVYNDLDDEVLARSVLAKYPQYNGVIKGANSTASTQSATKAETITEWDANGNPINSAPSPPLFDMSKAVPIHSDNPVTPDLTSFQPIVKLIQMPDGSTSSFAPTVTDDAIKKQWNHAKTAQTWKAVGWAGLFALGIALFMNYLLQCAYRALLFVIFGNMAQAA